MEGLLYALSCVILHKELELLWILVSVGEEGGGGVVLEPIPMRTKG